MGIQNTNILLLATAVGTIPCVLFDSILHVIQNWQRRRAGVTDYATFGPFVRTILSLIINFGLCAAFSYIYSIIWAGSGNAFLFGGLAWLMVAIPLLMTSRYIDEIQQKILATRILGWLFKLAAAALSVNHFIG